MCPAFDVDKAAADPPPRAMMSLIKPSLNYERGVTLLGGGPHQHADLSLAREFAPHLVCADGGANALDGVTPDAVIGDMDSLDDADSWRAALGEHFVHVSEQDSTDLEKCLRITRAPYFIGVGFAGGRVDHALAALHALVAEPRPVILIGDEDVIFAVQRPIRIQVDRGERVSFFPLAPVKGTISAGLKWSIEGLSMRAGETVGTSNEATSDMVEAGFDVPGAIAILPRARLGAVIAALGL